MFTLVPIAFVSGILTVLSPCVLPILPIILASGIDGDTRRVKGTIAGLVVSFTLTSLLLASIVRVFDLPVDLVRQLAVFMLVGFGISLVIPELWERVQAMIEKYWRISPKKSDKGGFWGGFITGVSLGVVWTPCVGPIIAAVATLAAVSSFSLMSVAIALAFALGAGVILYAIATGGSAISNRIAFVKRENQKIRQIFGIIILLTALFIWSGADRNLQAWTLENLPESWSLLTTKFEERLGVEKQIDGLKQTKDENGDSGVEVVNKVSLSDDFSSAKVAREDIIQGCMGMDCIPSIDKPKFESAEAASLWLEADDMVFAIDYNGVTRAYPQKILNWHEIVNDWAGETPIAITFCPLCGSALGFVREVDGVITQFGVSGLLHNSDLIMYDRYDGSLWQQITGEAIAGEAANRDERLSAIPIITVDWKTWADEHPETEVLSRDTGFSRDYGRYPYGTYEQDDKLLFGVPGLNTSLQIKTVVYGIVVDGQAKAYPAEVFEITPKFGDSINQTEIELSVLPNGEVEIKLLETEEQIIPTRLFWFAWAAFNPDTLVYNSDLE